jgi:hypothetical protein
VGQIEKITIGVADLFYTAPGATTEVYLGLTKGGGEFEYETEWYDIGDIDQFGKTIVDSVLIGEKATYKTSAVDTSLAAIKRVAPTATEIKSSTDSTKTVALTFGQRPGLRMQNVAGRLRVHPVSAGFDPSRDLIMYKAGSKAKLNLQYKLDNEWVVPCEWTAYPDETKSLGDQLFRIGDAEASLNGPTQRLINFYITPNNAGVVGSATQAFKASALYEDGTTADVTANCTWASSNAEAGTIAAGGAFTAAAVASQKTSVITATFGGYVCSTTVTVTVA